jgi:hypothetical protein
MANTFTLIASKSSPTDGTTTISFTSIPSTYTDLCLKMYMANDTGSWVDWVIQFNTNTSSYSDRVIYTGNGTSISGTTDASINLRTPLSTDSWMNAEVYIPNYAGSNNKSVSFDQAWSRNGSGSGYTFTGSGAGLWANTAAITSLQIVTTSGNMATNSTAYLYGIKNS